MAVDTEEGYGDCRLCDMGFGVHADADGAYWHYNNSGKSLCTTKRGTFACPKCGQDTPHRHQ